MRKLDLVAIIAAAALGSAALTALAVSSGRQTQPTAEAATAGPEAIVAAADPLAPTARPDAIPTQEAQAWAIARAADTPNAYEIYLAAFPEGAFRDEALARATTAVEAKPAPAPVRTASAPRAQRAVYSPPPAAPRRDVAGECRAFVDQKLSQPSRTARALGGAALGCGAGALAGGDDGRNCVIGAVVGAGAGAISAESRERRRLQEVQACIANGGPYG